MLVLLGFAHLCEVFTTHGGAPLFNYAGNRSKVPLVEDSSSHHSANAHTIYPNQGSIAASAWIWNCWIKEVGLCQILRFKSLGVVSTPKLCLGMPHFPPR
jgi:hypothetical protein